MKEIYEELELEVIRFTVEDIIRCSNTGIQDDDDSGDGGDL